MKPPRDILSAQLGRIATPVVEVTPVASRRFKSRFFFAIDEEEKLVQQFKPKVLAHVDDHVVRRTSTYRKEVSLILQSKIEQIRDYLLTEIAPLTMAASSGTKQAQQVVEAYLDTKVDTTLLAQFDLMVLRAAKVKLGTYVLQLFSLEPQHLETLFGKSSSEAGTGDRKLNQMLESILSQVTQQDRTHNQLTNQMKTVTTQLKRLPRELSRSSS